MSALLVWIAVAEALGILLADVVEPPARVVLATGALAFVAGLWCRVPRARALAACLAAACAGAFAMGDRIEQARRARPVAAFEATFDARVLRVRVGDGRSTVDLERIGAEESEPPLPRRLRLSGEAARSGAAVPGAEVGSPSDAATSASAPAQRAPAGDCLASLRPADRVRLRAHLRTPIGRQNPGAADTLHAFERDGIAAIGRLSDPGLCALVDDGRWRLRPRIEAARAALREALFRHGERAGLVVALALGDRRGLDRTTREAWAALGVSHLLSVSGLHLVLVAAGAFAAIRRLAASLLRGGRQDARRVALAGACVLAGFYAVLAGFDVPVQRSLVFVGALSLSFFARRPVRAPTLLAGAASIVLAADPSALFDAGAQLSFAASAALLLAPRLEGPSRAAGGASRVARSEQWIRDALSTSALATAATAPILSTHLGVTAPAGLLVNLIAVPFCGVVLLPGSLLATLLAPLDGWPLVGPTIDLVCAVAGATCALLRGAASASALLAPPAAPVSALSLGIVAVLALAALRARRLRTRLLLATLAALVPAWIPPLPFRPAAPRLVAFDVGQGDATLVQGRSAALLVDGGVAVPGGFDSGARIVVPALRALGVKVLDLVAVTHGDLDHRGGLPAVLDALRVRELWLPFGASEDAAFAALRAAATRNGVAMREVGQGASGTRFGDLVVTPLWPPAASDPALVRDNDRSLVLRVEVGTHRVLLAGDLEAAGEQALLASGADVRADVVGMGHHGSRTSSGARWLSALAARVAIASAPCEGRFGMPHVEAVRRVREIGASLWWTGRDGAVFVSLSSPLAVTGFGRLPSACPRSLARMIHERPAAKGVRDGADESIGRGD